MSEYMNLPYIMPDYKFGNFWIKTKDKEWNNIKSNEKQKMPKFSKGHAGMYNLPMYTESAEFSTK